MSVIGHMCFLTHFYPPLRSTFAVRQTASLGLGIMGEPRLPPLNPSETIVLWSTIVSGGFKGAPAVSPLCRETQSLAQQMLNATVGINGLMADRELSHVCYDDVY